MRRPDACLDDGPAAHVAIEPVCEADSAHAHLWRRLARSDPEFDREPPQATIDALIASGALAVDDPVLTQLEAVRRRLPHPHQRQTRTTGFRALPDPWSSLIGRRGRTDGPTGLVLVAARRPRSAVTESWSTCSSPVRSASPSPPGSPLGLDRARRSAVRSTTTSSCGGCETTATTTTLRRATTTSCASRPHWVRAEALICLSRRLRRRLA